MAKNKLVSPFLKWVGGKRQIMPEIVALLPPKIETFTFIEPFIGGGALLFNLQPKKAIINDANEELINVYITIRDHSDELIKDLETHRNESDYFYELRALDRLDSFKTLSSIKRASRLIFLNKTCFNGLYRVNNSGEFNSPFGRYKNPNIVNRPILKAVSNYLNNPSIEILSGDYNDVLNKASKKSFIYFDPPYHPVSSSSSFTGYVQGGWTEDDQIRLREVCDNLTLKGIKFLLSNSATSFIKDQYSKYNITTVQATRAINSDAEKRGEVDEFLIRNYD